MKIILIIEDNKEITIEFV